MRELEQRRTSANLLNIHGLCSLNGNKKCLKKIESIEEKLDKDEFIKISKNSRNFRKGFCKFK